MNLREELNVILDGLPDGQDYYCKQCPEELHYWTRSHQWRSLMTSYNVTPLRVKAKGVARDAKSETIRYTKRKPRVINGIEVKGQSTTSQSQTHTYDFRVDGIAELNEVFEKLCKEDGVEEVQIKELDVYSKDQGVELRSVLYNPDGNGQALYIVKFITDTEEKFYPELDIPSMEKFVGRFQGNMAQCSIMPSEDRQPVCVIKKKIKRQQIKRVKVRKKK